MALVVRDLGSSCRRILVEVVAAGEPGEAICVARAVIAHRKQGDGEFIASVAGSLSKSRGVASHRVSTEEIWVRRRVTELDPVAVRVVILNGMKRASKSLPSLGWIRGIRRQLLDDLGLEILNPLLRIREGLAVAMQMSLCLILVHLFVGCNNLISGILHLSFQLRDAKVGSGAFSECLLGHLLMAYSSQATEDCEPC